MIQQIVAFDVGDRRVGVAFSDPFGDYAIPSDTYFRTGDFQRDIAALCEIAASRGAVCAVVGLPLNEDGTESVQSEKTRRFAAALGEAGAHAGDDADSVFADDSYYSFHSIISFHPRRTRQVRRA